MVARRTQASESGGGSGGGADAAAAPEVMRVYFTPMERWVLGVVGAVMVGITGATLGQVMWVRDTVRTLVERQDMTRETVRDHEDRLRELEDRRPMPRGGGGRVSGGGSGGSAAGGSASAVVR